MSPEKNRKIIIIFLPEKNPEFCLEKDIGWGSGIGSLDNIADEVAEQLVQPQTDIFLGDNVQIAAMQMY